jgi:hypothetical protein
MADTPGEIALSAVEDDIYNEVVDLLVKIFVHSENAGIREAAMDARVMIRAIQRNEIESIPYGLKNKEYNFEDE